MRELSRRYAGLAGAALLSVGSEFTTRQAIFIAELGTPLLERHARLAFNRCYRHWFSCHSLGLLYCFGLWRRSVQGSCYWFGGWRSFYYWCWCW